MPKRRLAATQRRRSVPIGAEAGRAEGGRPEPDRGDGRARTRASEAALKRRLDGGGGRGPNLILLGLGGFLAIGAVAVLVALLVGGGSCGADCGTRQPDEGRTHIATGQMPTYRSVPATSGPHWNAAGVAPINWGIYPSPVMEPAVVHNLEHGGLVIWYQPSKLDAAGVKALTDYVRQQLTGARYKVILSPWSGKDFGHAIAVTAWDWLLYLDQPNTDAIAKFTEAHYEQAPEPGGGPGPPAPQ
jgi:hypothetical protein